MHRCVSRTSVVLLLHDDAVVVPTRRRCWRMSYAGYSVSSHITNRTLNCTHATTWAENTCNCKNKSIKNKFEFWTYVYDTWSHAHAYTPHCDCAGFARSNKQLFCKDISWCGQSGGLAGFRAFLITMNVMEAVNRERDMLQLIKGQTKALSEHFTILNLRRPFENCP